jgi:transposase-like protein
MDVPVPCGGLTGRTVESPLSRRREVSAAKTFFRKALRHHGPPRTITLDGFEPSQAALRRMGMRNEFNYRWENPVNIRSCQYLNNIVEQDHRRIKRRVQPILGFKKFYNARRVIMVMQMLHKDNSGWPRSELLSRCNRARPMTTQHSMLAHDRQIKSG